MVKQCLQIKNELNVLLGKIYLEELKNEIIFNLLFFLCLNYFKLKTFDMFLGKFIFKFIFK